MNDLLLACQYGYIDLVKNLVSDGLDVTLQQNQAIIKACQYGHLAIVKYLVSTGIDPSIYGNALIIYAMNHIDIIKFLVSTGMDIQDHKQLMISIACNSERLDIIRYLISSHKHGGLGLNWKKFPPKYQEILKAEQIQTIFLKKKFRHISKNLIPVYFSPQYRGGKLAKKELKNFYNSIILN